MDGRLVRTWSEDSRRNTGQIIANGRLLKTHNQTGYSI